MNNQLAKIDQMTDIMTVAKMFAESGMFETTKTQAQAVVKILAGQEIGIPAFAAISGIHIIKGKPTIGAGIIASCVKGSGKYDYKVLQMDEKICSIDFYQGKEKIGNSTFTIEDAKKAQTQNIDKFPRNMLFARAISNGVKWFCPDVFKGPVYTTEEMGEVTEDITHEDLTPPAPPVIPEKPKQGLKAKPFDDAVQRIGSGEHDLIQKLKDTYILTEAQLNKLVEIENAIAEAAANPA